MVSSLVSRAIAATVRAKRRIQAGEEFLIGYGRAFWGAGGDRMQPAESSTTGDCRRNPIVLSTLARKQVPEEEQRLRINMIRRGIPERERGEWRADGRWECACRERHNARVTYCPSGLMQAMLARLLLRTGRGAGVLLGTTLRNSEPLGDKGGLCDMALRI